MKKIIITGAPRTGTTGLANLLSHSSKVLVTNEVGVFERKEDWYHTRIKDGILNDPTNVEYLKLKGLTERDINRFFRGDFTNNSGIEFFGDKFPTYCSSGCYCRRLCRNHSDAYFIFTYRNPCATIYSGIKRTKIENDERADWFFDNLENSIERLLMYTSNWVNHIYPHVNKKLIIDYDHYINNSEQLVRDLSKFLNVDLDINTPSIYYGMSGRDTPTDPNSYKNEMANEYIETITTKTQALHDRVQQLLSSQTI